MKTFFLTWKKKLIYFYFFHIFTVGEKGDLGKIILAKVFPTVLYSWTQERKQFRSEWENGPPGKKNILFSPLGFCKKVMRWRKDVKDLKSKNHRAKIHQLHLHEGCKGLWDGIISTPFRKERKPWSTFP